MEIRHLRYFLAVSETENFRRAAERCYVAQSALSQQIARLEAELGNPLFFRTTRSVRLTPAGEALLPIARRIIRDAERANEEMAALAGLERGRLRLGIIQTGAAAIDLIALIAAFHRSHPGVALTARTGASRDLADQVVNGDLDLSVVALPPSEMPGGLTHRPIVNDPLVAVTSPGAARGLGEEVTLAALIQRGSFISYRRRSGLRHAVEAGFRRAGLDVEPVFELDQISDMIRLAALGAGVTIAPASSARPIPDEAPLAAHYIATPLADRRMIHEIAAVYDAERLGRAGSAFLASLPDSSPPAITDGSG